MTNFHNIKFELQDSEKELIKQKLESIMKEKAEITCRSIKFCVKIMSKLFMHISEEKEKETQKEKNTNSITNTNLLMKIKLFLKITKLIKENANQSLKNAGNKQSEFFMM
jgi:hypothetical protein